MGDFASNITKCHRCKKRRRINPRTAVCKLDLKDIIDHAEQNICPIGEFGVLGDVVEKVIEKATLGRVGRIKRLIERLMGRPCGCEGRKRWLNRLLRIE